jgi:hypothetical protein
VTAGTANRRTTLRYAGFAAHLQETVIMLSTRSVRRLLALLAFVGLAPAALAGPPLICHTFVTEAATPMLPWAASRDFYSPHPGYEVANLDADTLKLLSPDAPVLARMENMRRAAIYADRDPVVAGKLLGAVLARTETGSADPQAAALAWFDAGYLLETYRQLDQVYAHGMRHAHRRPASMVPAEAAELDGYVLVQKALVLAQDARPELEFAASLMTENVVAAAHRERAAAGAAADALLAQNLALFAVQ